MSVFTELAQLASPATALADFALPGDGTANGLLDVSASAILTPLTGRPPLTGAKLRYVDSATGVPAVRGITGARVESTYLHVRLDAEANVAAGSDVAVVWPA